MARDYYQVLNIAKDAGAEEVKKAYRRLAMKFHPDLNPDDPKTAEYFREITEAYGVLIDEDKRRRYDRDRFRSFQREDVYQDIFARQDYRDVFDDLPIRSEWLERLLMVSRVIVYEALVAGGSPKDVLKRSFLKIAAAGATRFFHNVMDIHEEISIPCDVADGGGHITIEYRPGFSRKRIKVSIPEGTKTGTTLRIPGMGRKNFTDKTGDLYLHVSIASL
jgi:DnaJ-class molecular chaperone